MHKADAEVLREVQKNSEMAMKAIDHIQDKVYDSKLASTLASQNIKYMKIRNKALKKIIDENAEPFHGTVWQDLMLSSAIHANTIWNTSTSHLAEMLIQGSNRGITHLWKSLNMHGRYADFAVEFAEELIDLEEENIAALRDYL